MLLRGIGQPPHVGLLNVLHDLAVTQQADRVRFSDELGVRQLSKVEVAPPGRFCLPAVPLEQVGQQSLGPVLVRVLVGIRRQTVQQ